MYDFLIVDDEVWVARLLSQIIDWEAEGFRLVGISNDSAEAIAMIAEKKPHLVLTDIKMPGMTGLELIETAQQYSENTQYVIVSGYNDFSYAKEAIGLRATGYLLKPVDEKELLRIVRYVYNQLNATEEKQRRSSDLEKTYLQAKEFRKNRLLLDMVRGHMVNAETEYQSVFDGKRKDLCFLAEVYVEDAREIKSVEAGFDVTMEVHMPRSYICCSCFDDHLVMALFTCEAQEVDAVREQLDGEFCKLIDKGGYGISLGIGKPVARIEELHLSCKEARDALTLRWVTADKRVFRSDMDQNSNALIGSICSQKAEIELLRAIKAYDEVTVEKILANMLHQACRWAEKNPPVLPATIEWIVSLIREEAVTKDESKISATKKLDEDLRNVYYAPNIDRVCAALRMCIRRTLLKDTHHNDCDENEGVIEKAKEFIDLHYVQDIGLSDVADAVHLNSNYFSTLFRQMTSVTFKEYLTGKRMEKAKHYLKDSRLTVNEISKAVGYNDVKTFLHTFKKIVGITPGDYRKLMTKNGR